MSTSNGYRLLIVDDYKEVRSLVSRQLQRQGYEVVEANCVTQAKKLLASDVFDLVITDVSLNDGNGIDMMAAIEPMPKTIFMSGYMQPSMTATMELEAGRNFIYKPFKIKTLAQMVGTAVNNDGDQN
ncbi:MAG: response regulator [Gammaproteobacteria bacterium]|nr:response regulator [Gammaproteobacteria bacterium]NNF59715.1 response regulator [Gammaproteobacteria bacterium]